MDSAQPNGLPSGPVAEAVAGADVVPLIGDVQAAGDTIGGIIDAKLRDQPTGPYDIPDAVGFCGIAGCNGLDGIVAGGFGPVDI